MTSNDHDVRSFQQQLHFPFPQGFPALSSLAGYPEFEDALEILNRSNDWPAAALALTGPRKSGVTLLLRAWQRSLQGRFVTAAELDQLALEEVDKLAEGCVAIDDVDHVKVGDTLLTLLNLAQERGHQVLLGAHSTPRCWPRQPPDLGSRLDAVSRASIPDMNEKIMAQRLVSECRLRFMKLPQDTLSFLMLRLECSYSAVHEFCEGLQRNGIASGRAPSIPLAREVLDQMGLNEDDANGAIDIGEDDD